MTVGKTISLLSFSIWVTLLLIRWITTGTTASYDITFIPVAVAMLAIAIGIGCWTYEYHFWIFYVFVATSSICMGFAGLIGGVENVIGNFVLVGFAIEMWENSAPPRERAHVNLDQVQRAMRFNPGLRLPTPVRSVERNAERTINDATGVTTTEVVTPPAAPEPEPEIEIPIVDEHHTRKYDLD
jgi:hypothetical protein